MDAADIHNRFTKHALDNTQTKQAGEVRDQCADLAHWLNVNLPEGREKSLAITHLEEVMFWSNAAIARPAK